MTKLGAPFPWFGGKSRVAAEVWERLGDVPHYVEPFAGSAAVLLARPDEHEWGLQIETINDADGFVSNFWRAVQAAPDEVAHWADWPVNENDLHARHYWLANRRDALTSRLEGDPEWCDAKIAGWWVWGLCAWIGGGWCQPGIGPWVVENGELVKGDAGQGINRRRPHLGNAGQGSNRKRPHLTRGRGINRQLPHLGDAGLCDEWSAHLRHIMGQLADRLRRVRVCSGDWSRVCGFSPTSRLGLTGVFLDPPYAHTERDDRLYVHEMECAEAVRAWAIERGDDPKMRIALCGYEGEREMPPDWSAYRWKAHGGYGHLGNGRGKVNRHREVVWFSPHCLPPVTGEQHEMELAL